MMEKMKNVRTTKVENYCFITDECWKELEKIATITFEEQDDGEDEDDSDTDR